MATSIKQRESDWSALLDASRAGDDEAFGEICDRLTEYLLLTASSRLGGGLSAKLGASDIVQQTLLEAQQDFTDFRGTSENEFRAWLVRLVQHNLIDSTRHFQKAAKRDTSREIALGMGDVEDTCPGSPKTASSIVRRLETDDELLRAVARLTARRRRIIDLRHWQGLSFAEIGKQLEVTEAAARNLWMRAVAELRKTLASDNATPPTQPR